ncbi:MAG: hypothetical protein ACXWXQ_07650 [Actinomycetota bacterium]
MVTATALLVGAIGVPAFGAERDRVGGKGAEEVTSLEAKAYGRWMESQVTSGVQSMPDMPLGELRDAAELAWAAGVPRAHLRVALFSDAARNILAGNAAAGEGRPSPYLAYFANDAAQLGRLGEFLLDDPIYAAGPGGTQDRLFAAFPGLRDSYLASLGLMEVNGRIVDPRAPYLSPYVASLLMGRPQPLPQPGTA